ncbi:MAG: hypothetical protein ACOY4H_03485 [Thermodesulfobacteriota bacterium]
MIFTFYKTIKKAVDRQPESPAYRNALARLTRRQKYGEEEEGGGKMKDD